MATGASEYIDNTTADVFIPELWSAQAIIAREQALLWGRLVNRSFEAELKMGDTLHVPSRGHLAARSKSANTAITFETVTETNLDISVATHEYTAQGVESITAIQNNRDQLAYYMQEHNYALALSVDDVLAGLPDNFTQTVGTLISEMTYDNWLRAEQYLDDANAPRKGRVIVVSPAEAMGLRKLDEFIHEDYIALHGASSGETELEGAYMKSFMGMPVFKSTNTEGSNGAGHDNAMFQMEALALVMQMAPKVHTDFDIKFFTDELAVEQLYGTKEMRDDHGVWLKGA